MPRGIGKMEFWSAGFGGIISVLFVGHGSEIKIRPSSAFHAQYSIIPLFQYSMGYLTPNTTPLSEL
jgi:hypothetical protein